MHRWRNITKVEYDQSRITGEAKFTYSPLSKAFEKQIKKIKDQGMKQVEALIVLKSDENKQDRKSIEQNSQNRWELMKLKMK